MLMLHAYRQSWDCRAGISDWNKSSFSEPTFFFSGTLLRGIFICLFENHPSSLTFSRMLEALTLIIEFQLYRLLERKARNLRNGLITTIGQTPSDKVSFFDRFHAMGSTENDNWITYKPFHMQIPMLRLCFKIEWFDGVMDWIRESKNYWKMLLCL